MLDEVNLLRVRERERERGGKERERENDRQRQRESENEREVPGNEPSRTVKVVNAQLCGRCIMLSEKSANRL